LTAAVVAFGGFLAGTVVGGRLARHIGEVRRWITAALGMEVAIFAVMALLAGTGVLDYHTATKLILIAALALSFGVQNATARQFGIQELSTTVLITTIVGIGFDSRLAGGTGSRAKLRYSVVLAMCGHCRDAVSDHRCPGDLAGRRDRRGEPIDLSVRPGPRLNPFSDRRLARPLSPAQPCRRSSRVRRHCAFP
jgi:hypothetical protein